MGASTSLALALTAAEAKHVAAQVKVGIGQAFDPLPRIAAWWLLQPLVREKTISRLRAG
jgi:hypothetical protein